MVKMKRCSCCGCEFAKSRPHSAPSSRAAESEKLDPKSAILKPLSHEIVRSRPHSAPSGRASDGQASSRLESRTHPWGDLNFASPRRPRSCRKAHILSQTHLVSTPLQSQSLDPYLAEAARQQMLSIGRLNPRKPGAQPFRISKEVDFTSPKFARALQLWETNRPNRRHIWEGGKQNGLLDSVRHAKYLPKLARSTKSCVDWICLGGLNDDTTRSACRPQSAGSIMSTGRAYADQPTTVPTQLLENV